MPKIGNGRIEGKIALKKEAGRFSLFSDHCKAMIHGSFCICKIHEAAPIIHTARSACTNAEHRLKQFTSSGTDQTIETENFPFPDIERYIFKVRRIFCGQVLNGQYNIPGLVIYRRKPIVKRTADHVRNKLIHVRLMNRLGHDELAVTQYGNLITDLKDLIHLVGNIDQRYASCSQIPHHLEQLCDLPHSQGGRRLIKYDQFRIV